MPSLVRSTDHGLYCEEGGFYVDAWSPVTRSIVTHAHADHTCWGCKDYLTSVEGSGVLRRRLPGAAVATLEYGRSVDMGGVRVSLHPAGHILGSSQVRIERTVGGPGAPAGEVWVVSGDYKVEPDATCRPFEVVRAHTFITESTFGLPIYRWEKEPGVTSAINQWWRENQQLGRTSVIFAYPLGKSQRVLAGLDDSIGPIGAHGQVRGMIDEYRAAGIKLPPAGGATGDDVKRLRGVGMVLAPPSTAATTWLRRLAGPEGISTAYVSGWMKVRGARRRRHVDRGFVLSDHADWAGLTSTINETGAERVGVTHGFSEVLVRWLSEQGREAFVVPSRFEGETGEVAEEVANPAPSE